MNSKCIGCTYNFNGYCNYFGDCSAIELITTNYTKQEYPVNVSNYAPNIRQPQPRIVPTIRRKQ